MGRGQRSARIAESISGRRSAVARPHRAAAGGQCRPAVRRVVSVRRSPRVARLAPRGARRGRRFGITAPTLGAKSKTFAKITRVIPRAAPSSRSSGATLRATARASALTCGASTALAPVRAVVRHPAGPAARKRGLEKTAAAPTLGRLFSFLGNHTAAALESRGSRDAS
jgi:hypothetical protein